MKFISILSFGIFISSLSFASVVDSSSRFDAHVRDFSEKSFAVARATRPGLIPGTFRQNVDHFGQSSDLFGQRYWVDSQYASNANAPVLYHICGEGDATDGYFLNDNAISWAKTLGARIVYLEHRYYGQSLPFSDFTSAHMRFLTLGNVIEDLATFQRWISTQQKWTGKWITLGGSYSGTLSAIYRQLHSDLIVGALASSAPMISGVGAYVGFAANMGDLSSTSTASNTGARPWAYQACTTFGFWEADGWGINANFMNPNANLCHRLFGNVALADSEAYNKAYDEPFISSSASAPSNILFTYGSNDVWTKIGLSEQTNENTKITIQMIDGAGHHFDLNAPSSSDSSSVTDAREEFVTLAKQWL